MDDTRRPSDWLIAHLDLIARDRPVLDIAAGHGRHTIYLAERGWSVQAVDRNQDALATLDAHARAHELPIRTTCIDLESGAVDLGVDAYGTVLVFNYLHRPLVPALMRALTPGGVLLYETFTVRQRERGHPRNPAFLLTDGELPELVAPLTVVDQREGEFDGKFIASVAAQKRLP
jgi:SAM-dependent methyltransferase